MRNLYRNRCERRRVPCRNQSKSDEILPVSFYSPMSGFKFFPQQNEKLAGLSNYSNWPISVNHIHEYIFVSQGSDRFSHLPFTVLHNIVILYHS